jgi:hypothetical protein
MAAVPARAKKDGGFGLGKAACFGILYHNRFRDPFQQAVNDVVQTYYLPDTMPRDVIAFHINKLRISLFGYVEALYQDALNKKEPWVKDCQSYSLTNTFRKILYRGYYSSDLPAYIPAIIRGIPNQRWNKFLTISIIVRHNHDIVAKQANNLAVHDRVKLMNASGMVGAPDAPQSPFPKEFFYTISFIDPPQPPLPAPETVEQPDPEQPAPAEQPPPEHSAPRRGLGIGLSIAARID